MKRRSELMFKSCNKFNTQSVVLREKLSIISTTFKSDSEEMDSDCSDEVELDDSDKGSVDE